MKTAARLCYDAAKTIGTLWHKMTVQAIARYSEITAHGRISRVITYCKERRLCVKVQQVLFATSGMHGYG